MVGAAAEPPCPPPHEVGSGRHGVGFAGAPPAAVDRGVVEAERFVSGAVAPERGGRWPHFGLVRAGHPLPAQPLGDRHVHRALHQIIVVRLGHDAVTKQYAARRTEEARTRRRSNFVLDDVMHVLRAKRYFKCALLIIDEVGF